MVKMLRVGIFSRSGTEDYGWLLQFLYSFLPRDNVHTVAISNHRALSITGISFAILYHSKNRGRINVTDVTDSLYDSELETLSKALGAKNVIVVIDDLDDNSEQVKERILENQPSIRILARDLFLFHVEEKRDNARNPTNAANKWKIQEMITERSTDSLIRWFSHCCSCPDFSVRTDELRSSRNRPLVLGLLVVVLGLYLLALYCYNYRVLLW